MKSNASKVVIKEIRFGPNTDEHDFQFKLKHAMEFLPGLRAGGGNFAEGLGNAPADIPRFLVHVPHETAHDVPHVFGTAFGKARDDPAQRGGGAVTQQRLQGQKGDERPHGGQAAGFDLVQMLFPVLPRQKGLQTRLQGAHARRAAFRCSLH